MRDRNVVERFVQKQRTLSRDWRIQLFHQRFTIDENTRILDLGSENGDHIARVLVGCNYSPTNIFIADISNDLIQSGHRKYNFTPLLITENSRLAYSDSFFDIVFCSSVIEHVTIDKKMIWEERDQKRFYSNAFAHQTSFAKEIKRLGKGYFVQTPNKFFPIETHTWLPLVGFLPRRVLIPLIKCTNKLWIKKTTPDWNLLSRKQIELLFPEADIVKEKKIGFTKSYIAIRSLLK